MLRKDKKRYQAVIVGAGRIGSGYDDPKSRDILTHAHAYTQNAKTNLAAIMDIDLKKAKVAAYKWSTKYFIDLEAMLSSIRPDIVSIATPDENHFATLTKVIAHKPRLIICEKPLTKTLSEADKIVRLAKKARVPILVNYRRRFEPYIQKVRSEIASKAYGNVIGASSIYSQGMLHGGSHVIDLCRYFFGEMVDSAAHYRIYDRKKNDPTVGGFVTFERCPQFYLMSGDERRYSIFEMTVFTEKKCYALINEGFQLVTQTVIKNPRFKGYKILGPELVTDTELNKVLAWTVKNAVDFLEGRASLLCDAAEATKTLKTCYSLLKQ